MRAKRDAQMPPMTPMATIWRGIMVFCGMYYDFCLFFYVHFIAKFKFNGV
jgi:hypothetical protein